MFSLPETKRVRRSDLYNSPSPSPRTNAPLALALALDLDFIAVAQPADKASPAPGDGDDLDFQLFSTTHTKISLRSPTPPPAAEDVWELQARRQKRPLAYYVLSEEDMEERRRVLRAAGVAVEAEEVRRGCAVGWPACRVPWKVTTIAATSAPAAGQPREGGKRGKPGKKRRIYLRVQEQKRKAVEEARLKSIEGRKKFAGLPREERELREREERNRRNREKKIKRRVRERAKKAAKVVGVGVDGGEESEGTV